MLSYTSYKACPVLDPGSYKSYISFAILFFISACFSTAWGSEICRHDLKVELQPEAHRLIAQDDIGIEAWKSGEISFLLSDKANIKSVLVNGKPAEFTFNSGRLTLKTGLSCSGLRTEQENQRVLLSPQSSLRAGSRSEVRGQGLLLSPQSSVARAGMRNDTTKLKPSAGPQVLSPGARRLRVTISYEAVFNDPVAFEPATFDNPGFGVTGTIGESGTFLLADSRWYPSLAGFGEYFNLEVTTPRGTYAVTAGELTGHEDRDEVSISRWKISPIGQGLPLSAGRYIVRSRKNGKVPVFTYFTKENEYLSQTYLDAAASYIEFYKRLHGPFPFPKFAVVENFFPTGYGFPSYTLLGGTVLRLPFIPQTSLRHEIAHSWWGNGVLVDYASGNWCEGLTTYVADYLSQEIAAVEGSGNPGSGGTPSSQSSVPRSNTPRGQALGPPYSAAKLYRQQVLQDYATLAATGADFPLRRFTGRSSPASRAVGYGKAAFVFHMVRQKLGDRVFWNCLRKIYRERLFVRTSWDDFREVFVRIGGWDPHEAKAFFEQWIERSGAPVLKLEGVQSQKTGASGWRTTGTLLQDPPGYDLDMTLALIISPNKKVDKKIRLKGGSASFDIRSAAAPQKLIVDPEANTFRLLAPEEIPATVNSVKASQGLLAVLTENGGQWQRAAFELLLAGLGHADTPILSEKEAEAAWPQAGDFLFFGLPRSEKLKSLFESAPDEVAHLLTEFEGHKAEEGSEGDSLVLVFKASGFENPRSEERSGVRYPTSDTRYPISVPANRITALFLAASDAPADSVLTAARKITHYGKYSYLTFHHGEIREKGMWEASRSPLEFDFNKK